MESSAGALVAELAGLESGALRLDPGRAQLEELWVAVGAHVLENAS